MSTLRLPPDEFALVRRAAAILRDAGEPRWPTPDELRDFLRDHVTVVKPGETLVIRTADLTPNQMREWQDHFEREADSGYIPFRVLVVHGDGLGVVEADR